MPPAQAPPPWGGYSQPPPSSNGKATAALVLGICGLIVCPLICSILALVFGYQGRKEIDASQGRQTGRGNAVAGIVLGWIGIAFTLAFIALIVVGILAGWFDETTFDDEYYYDSFATLIRTYR
jgi:Domain of unknown function (DUF4190)